MGHAVQVGQWFTLIFQSWWGFAALSVLGALALLRWQQWRAAAILRHAALSVPLLHQARPQLAQQMAYARRYERPFTVVVVCLEQDARVAWHDEALSGEGNGSRALQSHRPPDTMCTFFLAGALLCDAVRESDIVAYDAVQAQYVVLLPELTRPQALQAIGRLRDLVYRRTRLHLRAGLAAFPEDGLTMEALLTAARATGSQALADEVAFDLTGHTGG